MPSNVIETIGNLNDLKPYACPKAVHNGKEWYLTCIDCAGLNGCTAGKQAVGILNKQTKPGGNIQKAQAIRVEQQKEQIRQRLAAALQHESPVQYIMDIYGSNKKTASERLRRWKISYPDVFEKYSRKDCPENPTSRKDHNLSLQEEAYRKAEEILSQKDPLAYLLSTSYTKRASAMNRIYKYIIKYPDLAKKYNTMKWYDSIKGKAGRKRKGEETMAKSFVCTPDPRNDVDGDEISVSDFLVENSVKSVSEYLTDRNEKKIEPVREPAVSYSRISKEDILLEAVKAKRQEIFNTIKGLEHDIAIEKEKLTTLTKTMAILTGDIFPENPE